MVTKDFIKLLQVDLYANPIEIAAAFRRLSLKVHPDMDPSSGTNKKLQELNEAWEILRDPHKRIIYDFARSYQTSAEFYPDYTEDEYPPQGIPWFLIFIALIFITAPVSFLIFFGGSSSVGSYG